MNYINKETLKKYSDNELIYSQKHPKHNLYIWNYTKIVQWDYLWDDVTSKCRGLILDENGNLIAKSYDKFFNFEEIENLKLNYNDVIFYDKLDGQLALLFNYNGEWIFTSRGSFNSDYSNAFKKHFIENYNFDELNKNCTYIFELIGFEKIICEYNDINIILTGVHDNKKMLYENISNYEYKFRIAETMEFNENFSLNEIKKLNVDNKEGYVFFNKKTGERGKIKFEHYVYLHSLKNSFTEKKILNKLIFEEVNINSFLENIPDEFYSDIKNVIDNYCYIKEQILNYIKLQAKEINLLLNKGYERKDIYLLKKDIPLIKIILFELDDKDTDIAINNLIYKFLKNKKNINEI